MVLIMIRQRVTHAIAWANENQGWLALAALIISIVIAFIDINTWSLLVIVVIFLLFIGIPILFKEPRLESAASSAESNITTKQTRNAVEPPPPSKNEQSVAHKHTPREIIAEIKKAPVYSQPSLQKAYIGLSVEWKVTFHTLFIKKGGVVDLMLLDRGNYPWVYAMVNINKYPQLKILKEGASFRITGVIQGFEGGGVRLNNGKLHFK